MYDGKDLTSFMESSLKNTQIYLFLILNINFVDQYDQYPIIFILHIVSNFPFYDNGEQQ